MMRYLAFCLIVFFNVVEAGDYLIPLSGKGIDSIEVDQNGAKFLKNGEVVHTILYPDLLDVRQIDLSNNRLTKFPINFCKLTPLLKQISVSNNNIEKLEATDFDGLSLFFLELDKNPIQRLESDLFSLMTSLDALVIGSETLQFVGDMVFAKRRELTNLYITGGFDKFSSKAFEEIPIIKLLNLNGNNLSRIPGDKLKALSNVMYMDLGFNNIDTIYSKDFDSWPQLTIINLGDNKIKNIRSNTFSSAKSLSQIVLANNPISLIAKDAFTSTVLTKIVLDGNHLTKFPINSLATLPLREISITSNKIDTISSEDFIDLPFLEQLVMDGNNISSLPANAFSALGSLRVLSLKDNAIANMHQDSLSGLANIEELSLENNSIFTFPRTFFHPINNIENATILLGGNPALEVSDCPSGSTMDIILHQQNCSILACVH